MQKGKFNKVQNIVNSPKLIFLFLFSAQMSPGVFFLSFLFIFSFTFFFLEYLTDERERRTLTCVGGGDQPFVASLIQYA